MAQIQKTIIRQKTASKPTTSIKHTGVGIQEWDDALPPDDSEENAPEEDTDALENDDGDGDCEQYDPSNDSGDMPDFSYTALQRPIWLLFNEQLLWAADRPGYRLAEYERLRRKLQALLDYLSSVFPEKEPFERLLLLRGYFVAGENKKGTTTGSVFGNDDALSSKTIVWPGGTMSLKELQSTRGKGRGTRLPDALEFALIRRELPKHLDVKTPLGWRYCKGWVMETLGAVCEHLNDQIEKIHVLAGIAQRTFGYTEDSITKGGNTRLSKWKEVCADILADETSIENERDKTK